MCPMAKRSVFYSSTKSYVPLPVGRQVCGSEKSEIRDLRFEVGSGHWHTDKTDATDKTDF